MQIIVWNIFKHYTKQGICFLLNCTSKVGRYSGNFWYLQNVKNIISVILSYSAFENRIGVTKIRLVDESSDIKS